MRKITKNITLITLITMCCFSSAFGGWAEILSEQRSQTATIKALNKQIQEDCERTIQAKDLEILALKASILKEQREKQDLISNHNKELGLKSETIIKLQKQHLNEIKNLAEEKTSLITAHNTAIQQKSKEIVELQSSCANLHNQISKNHAQEIKKLNQEKARLFEERLEDKNQCGTQKTALTTKCDEEKNTIKQDLEICTTAHKECKEDSVSLLGSVDKKHMVCNLNKAFVELARKHASQTSQDTGDVLANNELYLAYLEETINEEKTRLRAFNITLDECAFVRDIINISLSTL